VSSGGIAGGRDGRDGRVSESVRGVPAPALRSFVSWYSGYRQAGVPPTTHRGLPSPYLTLIITLDDPLDLAVPTDPGRPPGRYRTLLGGLHTRPAIIGHDGRQSGIQLGVRPLGARVLLGLPAGELHDLDIDAADVLGPVAAELHERALAGTGDDWALKPGSFGAYVVTDDPDGLFPRATAGGAKVIKELHDTDYGSRDFIVLDPEGNRWSFGTYRGEPRKVP
jgi:hypothetical protein